MKLTSLPAFLWTCALSVSLSAVAIGTISVPAWQRIVLPTTLFASGLGVLLWRYSFTLLISLSIAAAFTLAVIGRFFAGPLDGSVGRTTLLCTLVAISTGYQLSTGKGVWPLTIVTCLGLLAQLGKPSVYSTCGATAYVGLACLLALPLTKRTLRWQLPPLLAALNFVLLASTFVVASHTEASPPQNQTPTSITGASSTLPTPQETVMGNGPVTKSHSTSKPWMGTLTLVLVAVAICLMTLVMNLKRLSRSRQFRRLQKEESPKQGVLNAWVWASKWQRRSSEKPASQTIAERMLQEKVKLILFEPGKAIVEKDAKQAWGLAKEMIRAK